jgi:hypothetical protein
MRKVTKIIMFMYVFPEKAHPLISALFVFQTTELKKKKVRPMWGQKKSR